MDTMGFYFDENDPDRAAEQILALHNDRALLSEFSKNVQLTFDQKFRRSRMVQETEKLYLEVGKNR